MGVLLDSYRIQIGAFHLTGRNNQFKFRKQCGSSRDSKKFKLFSVFLLLFLFVHNPETEHSGRRFECYDHILKPTLAINSQCKNIPCSPTLSGHAYSDALELSTWSLSWSHPIKTNALCHSLFGNRRRLGYKLALWNCRKGLLQDTDFDSSKLTEIKLFIKKHNPHTFGIIESNIHSSESRVQRRTTFKTHEVEAKLQIDGYKLKLPDTWLHFGQARVIVYVRNDINYKRKQMQSNTDLPNITLEIGLGREKKTVVNYFYREWTGGVSGQNSQGSQIDRILRQIGYWRTLYAQNRDVVCMGDANLCALSWNENEYEASKKVLANCVQEHLLEESSYQIVQDFTRSETTRNGLSRSCIDHIYTNAPSKCDKPKVESAGDSDHLAVVVNKYTKELQLKPHAVLKRSYKNFDPQSFLLDIQNCSIDEAVTACDDFDEAAQVFKDIFGHALDRHAPRKIFQTRKNYVPYLSEETKLLMAERDALQEEATKHGDRELMKEYKKLRNKVRHQLPKEQPDYYKKMFLDKTMSIRKAWKLVYDLLGKVQSKSPSKINFENKVYQIQKLWPKHSAKFSEIKLAS